MQLSDQSVEIADYKQNKIKQAPAARFDMRINNCLFFSLLAIARNYHTFYEEYFKVCYSCVEDLVSTSDLILTSWLLYELGVYIIF